MENKASNPASGNEPQMNPRWPFLVPTKPRTLEEECQDFIRSKALPGLIEEDEARADYEDFCRSQVCGTMPLARSAETDEYLHSRTETGWCVYKYAKGML